MMDRLEDNRIRQEEYDAETERYVEQVRERYHAAIMRSAFAVLVFLGSATLLAAVSASVSGCQTALQAGAGTLATLERQVEYAASAVRRVSHEGAEKIREESQTREEYDTRIKAWRAKIDTAWKSVEGTHNSIRLARDAMRDAQKGLSGPRDLSVWVQAASHAASNLLTLLRSIGVSIPGLF